MSQVDKIYQILSDGNEHRFDEIQTKLFGGTKYGAFRLGARIDDLRKKGYVILDARPDPINPTLSWYQIIGKVNRIYKAEEGIPDDMKPFKKYSDYLPALHYDEVKTQPLLFPLPEIERVIKMPN